MRNYNKSNVSLARTLRSNMTRHEKKLWYDFLKLYDVRFQRQKLIGNYIVDFYCAKANLIIEIDGSGHYESQQIIKDNIRTADLEKMNLTVVRFCNSDIDNNFRGVCEYIDCIVKKLITK